MRYMLICCSTLAVLLLNGCVSTNAGLGETVRGPGTTALPSGLRLLESEQEACEGTVQIGGASGLYVQPGQNATFRVAGGEIVWSCLAGTSSDTEKTSCPDTTTHVRLTRSGIDEELLFECYGA